METYELFRAFKWNAGDSICLPVLPNLVAQSLEEEAELAFPDYITNDHCKIIYDGSPSIYHTCDLHPAGVLLIFEDDCDNVG